MEPSVLRAADASPWLPRLGGIARPDGVVIASERFWALARVDGTLEQGAMPAPRPWVRRVPVLRGLVRLALAFAPLARGRTATRRERALLLAAVLAPALVTAGPPRMQLALELVVMLGIAAWLFRGRTLFLHGAEHRAIEACERRQLSRAWSGEARPTRFSRRCGTNLAALALGLTALLYVFVPAARSAVWSLPIGLGALGATLELWFLIQAAPARVARLVLAPGLALQRLTTREPALEETRLALRAAASVLERELAAGGYQRR
jgi:uncharacterized protein YqhQ